MPQPFLETPPPPSRERQRVATMSEASPLPTRMADSARPYLPPQRRCHDDIRALGLLRRGHVQAPNHAANFRHRTGHGYAPFTGAVGLLCALLLSSRFAGSVNTALFAAFGPPFDTTIV